MGKKAGTGTVVEPKKVLTLSHTKGSYSSRSVCVANGNTYSVQENNTLHFKMAVLFQLGQALNIKAGHKAVMAVVLHY